MSKVIIFPGVASKLAVAIANRLGSAEMLSGPTADAIPIVEHEILDGPFYAVLEEEEAYRFNEKAAAKSSTGVLVSTPGVIACPSCGCRPVNVNANAVTHKKGCTCKCHS